MMQRDGTPMQDARHRQSRIEVLDVARGVALVAMAIYHFAWDLEFFGYAEAGMTAVGGWRLFARCIASSFLFLVGISLVLAHGDGIRWKGFRKRLLQIVAAALAITVATRIATPDSFIFFGILHQIAFASVAGLLFLRLPAFVTLLAAVAVIAAPHLLRSEWFDAPALSWLGLSVTRPHSNDFVPVFPWFGAVLAGMAAAQFARSHGLFDYLARFRTGRLTRPLDIVGRHSLAFYLVHQPVLIGLVYIASLVAPAPPPDRAAQFTLACERQCTTQRDAAFCTPYCACMLTTLQSQDRLHEIYGQPAGAQVPDWLDEMAWQCTAETGGGMEPQGEDGE